MKKIILVIISGLVWIGSLIPTVYAQSSVEISSNTPAQVTLPLDNEKIITYRVKPVRYEPYYFFESIYRVYIFAPREIFDSLWIKEIGEYDFVYAGKYMADNTWEFRLGDGGIGIDSNAEFSVYGKSSDTCGTFVIKLDSLTFVRVGPYREAMTSIGLVSQELGKKCPPIISSVHGIQKDDIEIFPNPATHYIRIKNSTPGSFVQIMASSGQIFYEAIIDHTETISTTALPPGLYFLKIETGGIYRFVKN